MYRTTVRRALFALGGGDPEIAHERTVQALSNVARVPPVLSALHRYLGRGTPRTVFGVRFPNAVGLAAGVDKNGRAIAAWPALGFGHVEIGTVTRHAQPGNPRPRLYRLPASGAVINRMGFNNDGADAVAARLAATPRPPVPLGISIGKSKVTPVGEAVEDYLYSLRALHHHADYIAVNVSSPNTPGLRSLQDRGALTELLAALAHETASLADGGAPLPLLVKIAPDLTDEAIGELLQVCAEHAVAGVIAGNTTLARGGLAEADEAAGTEPGGLSGAPLAARAREIVRFVHSHTAGLLPVIGVGGIMTPDDARRMVDAGADLVQLYTGFIYHGPALVRGINRALRCPAR